MTRLVENRVMRGVYFDSVALMRASRRVEDVAGILGASLMIGTESNKAILREAGLLAAAGEAASPNDVVLALAAVDTGAAVAGFAAADAALGELRPQAGARARPRTLGAAAGELAGANLALVSVPGAFAAAEAAEALRHGLHVLIFSDNVPVTDEIALKRKARERGLLVMGPDCGTAFIAGVPLAFANEVPRGNIGIVAASGTGLQEVACLLARAGAGVSHGIGVGGRDMTETVGGLGTLAAIDALDRDPGTRHIVLVSKPPAPGVARAVFQRVAQSAKPFTLCLLGQTDGAAPANARVVGTLREAAEAALGRSVAPAAPAIRLRSPARRRIRGLYAGGTLAAEAQLVLMRAGLTVASNAPVPGAAALPGAENAHGVLDLGADEYTSGRPHPMIAPEMRTSHLRDALANPCTGVVLLDVVLGYGAHEDPAGEIARVGPFPADGPVVIASVTGTEGDPQVYSRQVAVLKAANVHVAGSNAEAAALAADAVKT